MTTSLPVVPARTDTDPPPGEALRGFPMRELRRRELLYRVHDRAETAYRVEEGLLALAVDAPAGRERILALVGPGEWLGALAPGATSVRERACALSDRVRVRVVPRRGVDTGIEHALFAAAGMRLASLHDALEEADLPVRTRLARVLSRLGQRFGQPGPDGSLRLTLPVTHETLAGLVGAARETTTSLMSELRRAGAVEGTRGRYRLRVDTLVTIAWDPPTSGASPTIRRSN